MYFDTFVKFPYIIKKTANRWNGTNNPIKRSNDAALIWYLGTQETVRSISERLDVQESTRRLIDVFSDLCKKFVKWPNNEEKQEIMSKFEDFSEFPVQ